VGIKSYSYNHILGLSTMKFPFLSKTKFCERGVAATQIVADGVFIKTNSSANSCCDENIN